MTRSNSREIPPLGPNELIIYTCLFGEYDNLSPVPAGLSGVRFICFSDRPFVARDGWEIVYVRRIRDPARETRYYKILSNRIFPNARHTLWVDANLRFRCDPRKLVSRIHRFAPDAELAIPQHAKRNCAYDEGEACIRLLKAGHEAVAAYLQSLRDREYPQAAGMWQCSLIYRRRAPAVRTFEERWWLEFTNGPPRDQLSVGLALELSGVALHTISTWEYKKVVRTTAHRKWWVSVRDRLHSGPVHGIAVGTGGTTHSEELLRNLPELRLIRVDRRSESPRRPDANPSISAPSADDPAESRETTDARSTRADSNTLDQLFDFVLIDTPQSSDEITSDLQYWKNRIKPGGWIFGFNYQCEQNRFSTVVTQVIDRFAHDIGSTAENGAQFTWFIQIPNRPVTREGVFAKTTISETFRI